jgi:hypothetical protein
MAVATTFVTTPILHAITRRHSLDEEAPPQPIAEAPSRQGGLLVPVSNPLGLGPLLDLALGATRDDDPPPRVLALVRRPPGGIRTGLRELEGRRSPTAPILADAIARAEERGGAITTQAIWTDDPADDIVQATADPRIGWLLLGFHRPTFGGDLLGGVVKDVLEKMERGVVSVGIVVHGHERPLDRVVAVADDSDDGRAALELAARVAKMKGSTLHAVLVPKDGSEPEPALQELLKNAGRDAGRWLHTDVLAQRNPAELAYKTRGDLVLIGTALADELGLPLDDPPGLERCIVLVRGARAPLAATTDVSQQKAS